MFRRLKNLVKLSTVYTASNILNRGFVFLLVPLYTRYLTTAEFGILAITDVVTSVGKIILSYGLQAASFRFYYIYQDEEDRKRFYGTIWLFSVITSLTITLVLSVLGEKLLGSLFREVEFSPYIQLAIWISYLRAGFELIPLQVFRARGQAWSYSKFSLASFLLTTATQIYMVAILKLGVVGALYGNLLASIVMAVFYSLAMFKIGRIFLSWDYLKPALAYSLPMMPHLIANWLLSLSDRFILERNVGLSDLGVYSLGDQFRQGYSIVTWGVNSAFMPTFGEAGQSLESPAYKALPRLVTYYILTLAVVALVFTLFAPEIVVLIASVKYAGAVNLVPWLVYSGLVYGLYYVPMNVITQIDKRTLDVSLFTLTAGAINIGLNLYFVPIYGIMAAAVNQFIGYMVLLLLIFVRAQRVFRIEYELARIVKILFATIMTFTLSQLFPTDSWLLNTLLKSIIFLVFPIFLWRLGFLTPSEQAGLMSLLVRFSQKKKGEEKWR